MINPKLLVDAADSMYFSVRHKSLGSLLVSTQVKQVFSEEQVAHNEGHALQTGFVVDYL